MDSLANFQSIRDVAILDVYGSEDHEAVLDAARQRKRLSADMQGSSYRELEIDGAGHFYQNKQEELVSGLSSRLDKILAP